MVGPLDRTHVEGSFTASSLDVGGVTALTATGEYTLDGPIARLNEATITGEGSASFVTAFGQNFGSASAKLTYDQQRVRGEVEGRLPDNRIARVSGSVLVHADHNELHVWALQIALANQRWALSPNAGSPSYRGADPLSRRATWCSMQVLGRQAGSQSAVSWTRDAGRRSHRSVEDVAIEDLPPIAPVVAGYRGRSTAR